MLIFFIAKGKLLKVPLGKQTKCTQTYKQSQRPISNWIKMFATSNT